MIKMAVFDMAGTVIDEQNVVYKTLHETLIESGVQTDFETVLALGAGKEKKNALTDIVNAVNGDTSIENISSLFNNFKNKLVSAYQHLHVIPQPGSENLFKELRGREIFIILNTGYDRTTALQLLDKLQWQIGKEYDYLVTASDVYVSRPASEMIDQAMAQFGIDHGGQVLKVGDSVIDIEEGFNAGCRYVVGITSGAHTKSQLLEANPTHVIDHLSELLEIIDTSGDHGF